MRRCRAQDRREKVTDEAIAIQKAHAAAERLRYFTRRLMRNRTPPERGLFAVLPYAKRTHNDRLRADALRCKPPPSVAVGRAQ